MVHTLFFFHHSDQNNSETHIRIVHMQRSSVPVRQSSFVSYQMENIPKVHKEQQLRMNLELKSIHCSEQ